MHPSMTSPLYPTVMVVWGSCVEFCYKCLRVFLSFCSTDGKVRYESVRWMLRTFVVLVDAVTSVQMLSSGEGPKVTFGLCSDGNLLLECKQDSFHIWPPTPPRISLWNHTSAIMTHLGQSDLFVCDLPGVNFNNLLWVSLSLCRVSVGLQVISVAPVGGSQRGLP